ncbi:hypothetical protein Bca52824_092207 [Brassica carinata]|uniref:RING-type E3 ubiquitin transferase n=1 Tax=Brassica carinata TaxID=52824 RepID=A0A8X7NTW4_BRACI|nr:hypothetical protein Bca52824_092207 [Brassica carinata]
MKSLLPLTRKQYTFVMFLLLAGSELASSQPGQSDPSNPYEYSGRLSPAMAGFVVAVVAMLFFVGFFTVYLRHCTHAAADGSVNHLVRERRMTNATAAHGLDASVIKTFPTFIYSEVKTQKIGNGALECAICLNEFQDDETLRLLPKCDHVFHPHCIGAWLQGHVTCPVCRTNLADQHHRTEPVEPEVITETDVESQQPVIPEPAVESVARVKLPRSHTTGHSMILPGECTERFTLRLPNGLRMKLMANGKIRRSNSLLVLPRSGPSTDEPLFIKTPPFMWRSRDDGSIRRGRGDSINTSCLWRSTLVPSPRVEVSKDGKRTSSDQTQCTETIGLSLTSDSVWLSV